MSDDPFGELGRDAIIRMALRVSRPPADIEWGRQWGRQHQSWRCCCCGSLADQPAAIRHQPGCVRAAWEAGFRLVAAAAKA